MRAFLSICLALVALAQPTPGTARDQAVFGHRCLGNAVEACFLFIDGPIDTGLTERIRAEHPNGIEGTHVYLNSPGGDLGEALKLGRYLRGTGLTTKIGVSTPGLTKPDGSVNFPEGGLCESACAYVFMGGQEREMSGDDTLGLHRFWAPGAQIDGESAQVISGQLVNYMVEMGVDPRVFRLAAEQGRTGMYQLTRAEAQEFDLVTPSGYAPLFMEPYKGGVIASSKRLEPTGPYDSARQITFFCRNGRAFALITAEGGFLADRGDAPVVAVEVDGTPLTGNSTGQVRSAGTSDLVTIGLSDQARAALPGAETVLVSAWWSRVLGGRRGVMLSLSDMDRAMIAAAFTHCIG